MIIILNKRLKIYDIIVFFVYYNKLKQTMNEKTEVLNEIEIFEKNVDKKYVDQLQQLVQVYEGLKEKEITYKKKCKEELIDIEAHIENLKATNGSTYKSEDSEKQAKINEQYESTKIKLSTLRLKVAKKNREMSTLKRKLDEVPSRTELNQYQKRFIELYNQSKVIIF